MNTKNQAAEKIITTRDVTATLVPFGEEITLPKGTEVTIVQSLGGTFTVVANYQMLRIASKDADALGKKIIPFEKYLAKFTGGKKLTLEEKIWFQLSTCYDPEIPVNIVDLGLIYSVEITPIKNEKINDTVIPKKRGRPKKAAVPEQKYNVVVKMTLTAPGCGMGPLIAAEAKQKILSIPEVNLAEIEFVFEPPWDRSRMSDQAKLELGLL